MGGVRRGGMKEVAPTAGAGTRDGDLSFMGRVLASVSLGLMRPCCSPHSYRETCSSFWGGGKVGRAPAARWGSELGRGRAAVDDGEFDVLFCMSRNLQRAGGGE